MASTPPLSEQQFTCLANLILNEPKLLEQLLEKVYSLLQENLSHTHERI